MSTIVVLLDGSATAEAAIPHAVRLARALGDSVTLFSVAGSATPGFREFAEAEGVSLAQAAETYLGQLCGDIGGRVEVVTTVSTGNSSAADILTFLQSAPEIEMVVMARHGRSGRGQWLIGSVTDKMVRASSVPVLVVPV